MMSGIGIDFMLGAQLLATINLLVTVLVLWLVYRVFKKVFYEQRENDEKADVRWEVAGLGIATLLFAFFGTSAAPKLTIDSAPNRQLVEYQRNVEELVIETPAPRTETLEGFTPLGE